MKNFESDELSDVVNLLRKSRLVLKNGVSARSNKAIKTDVFMFCILEVDGFVCAKDIVNTYFLKRNCSCENVLCAIGVFKLVSFDCLIGWTKNEGTCTASVDEYAPRT